MAHPQWPALSVANFLQDERLQMMSNPKSFEAYVEHPARVSGTALIHFQRNRYSIRSEYAHRVVSLRVYPSQLKVIADGGQIACHERSFGRDQTRYDFHHYISLVERKPGALRNGAP